MRFTTTLAFLLLVGGFSCALAQMPSSSGNAPTMQNASLPAGQTSITGCVHGNTDQYYLLEKNGTLRVLMGSNRELQALVGQNVTLGGNRDLRRDASASSDEGTPHGLRFFQVEEVLADQGACK